MKIYCAFLIFVLITEEAFGLTLRNKRQTKEKSEDKLEDRYGWSSPIHNPMQPSWPGQNPNQVFGRWPNSNVYPDQTRYPNLGMYPNQGRFPIPGPFPYPNGFPGNWPFPSQQSTTQAPIGGSSTPAESNPTVQDCIRNCPVTSEYNPVCGSNYVTYPNPGRLYCAQACGISVTQLRSSPCPTQTTLAPATV